MKINIKYIHKINYFLVNQLVRKLMTSEGTIRQG